MNREQRRQRKRKQREERIRQERAREPMRREQENASRAPARDVDVAAAAAAAVGARPFQTERTLLDLHRAMEGKEFASAEEMNAYAQTLVGPGLKMKLSGRPPTPKERAQELAFDAMETADAAEALRVANLALEFDPDNLDALGVQASMTKLTLEEFIKRIERAVAVGRRVLGEPYFEENRGEFWGRIETRPFMRTLHGLAKALWKAGREEDAVGCYEELLTLNPRDNQGVRYELVGCYLVRGELAGARQLLDEQFAEDVSGTFAWARVLLRWLSGDRRRADAELRTARQRNRHAQKYLAGWSRIPVSQASTYTMGNESEAIVVAEVLGEAWQRHGAARQWLASVGRRGEAVG